MSNLGNELSGLTFGVLVNEGNHLDNAMCSLLRQFGGNVIVCRVPEPAQNSQNDEIVRRLITGGIDLAVFLTAAGTKQVVNQAFREVARPRVVDSLCDIATLAGSPRVTRFLKEIGIEPTIELSRVQVWRNVLTALDEYYRDPRKGGLPGVTTGLANLNVAVEQTQVFPSLAAGLEARGSCVYRMQPFGTNTWTPSQATTTHGSSEFGAFFASAENDDLHGIVFVSPASVVEFFDQVKQLRSQPWRDQVLFNKLLIAVGADTDEILGDHGLGGDVVASPANLSRSPRDIASELLAAYQKKSRA